MMEFPATKKEQIAALNLTEFIKARLSIKEGEPFEGQGYYRLRTLAQQLPANRITIKATEEEVDGEKVQKSSVEYGLLAVYGGRAALRVLSLEHTEETGFQIVNAAGESSPVEADFALSWVRSLKGAWVRGEMHTMKPARGPVVG